MIEKNEASPVATEIDEPTKKKLLRSARLAGSFSLIGLLIVVALLVYSSIKLVSLQRQLDDTKQQLRKASEELNSLQQKLEEGGTKLGLSPKQILLLENEILPNLPTSPTDHNLLQFIEQVNEAEELFNRIKDDTADKKHRSPITVRYYQKDGDQERGNRAIALLSKRGFKIEITPFIDVRDLTPTNAIWIMSTEIPSEDVKLITYTLIKCGIEIKYTGPYQKPLRGHIQGKMIWIGADQDYTTLPTKTVKEIQNVSKF